MIFFKYVKNIIYTGLHKNFKNVYFNYKREKFMHL